MFVKIPLMCYFNIQTVILNVTDVFSILPRLLFVAGGALSVLILHLRNQWTGGISPDARTHQITTTQSSNTLQFHVNYTS